MEAPNEEAATLSSSGYCRLRTEDFPAIFTVLDTSGVFAQTTSHLDPVNWATVFGSNGDRWMCSCEDPKLLNALHALCGTIQAKLEVPGHHMGHLPAWLGRGSACTEQQWHRDDSSGYSIIVPFSPDYTVDVIPGSHLTTKDDTLKSGHVWQKDALEKCHTRCSMDLGDILVLDARVVHRGGPSSVKPWMQPYNPKLQAVYDKVCHGLSLHIYMRDVGSWEWPSKIRRSSTLVDGVRRSSTKAEYLWDPNSSLSGTHKLSVRRGTTGRSMEKELQELEKELQVGAKSF